MDTRFWGPSGWKLLHYITFKYDPLKQKKHICEFFETIPYVLPCKFCRASLTEYYEKHPLKPALKSRATLTKWLYTIHNEVNAKLRAQSIHVSPDPPFKEVSEYYNGWSETPEKIISVFWNFLFSIAQCHPSDTRKTTKPMPNCPAYAKRCKSKKIRNRWNTLKVNDRLRYYKQFWHSLPDALEPRLREIWLTALEKNPPALACRRSSIAWLWRMRCAIEADYSDPYTLVCKKISAHSSDCSTSSRAKTCRRKRHTFRRHI